MNKPVRISSECALKKLILHIGAHRCGSTAIQTMLDGLRRELKETSVSIVMRRDMECGILDFRRLHRFNRLNPMWIYRLWRLADDIKKSASRTIIVSEENIMGTMPGVLSSEFYPYFSKLISGFAFLAGQLTSEWEICPRLVVRRQDHYLESVYAFRVSRGLMLGFNDFLAQFDVSSLSWLPFLDQLSSLQDTCDVKIAAIETWRGDNAVNEAAQFLEIPHKPEMNLQRLRGNRRYDEKTLRLMLACNRAGVEGNIDLDKAQLHTGNPTAIIEQFGDRITSKQRSQLINELSDPLELGFSEFGRHSFMAAFKDQNNEFLNHDSVVSGSTVWD